MAKETYTIVWQPSVGVSPTGNDLLRTVSFPYLVEGADRHALEVGSVIELGKKPLLMGILVAYDEGSRVAVVASREEMKRELVGLATIPGQPPLEILLLNAAAYVRERFGTTAGLAALRTAMDVVPGSAMIKSDLLTTLWHVIETAQHDERTALLQDFASLFPQVNLDLIDPVAAELIIWAELHVLTELGRRDERDDLARSCDELHTNT